MKTFHVIPVLVFLSVGLGFRVLAQDTNTVASQKIGARETAKHYDESLTVTGKVAQVTIRPNVVFLNLDEAFPNSPFTGVVFADNTNRFGDLSKLRGKDVEITGKIKSYRDAPEIVLTNASQLKIVEKPTQ